MNYTIATTRDFNGMQYVNFDIIGNKYLVGFTGKAEGEYTHKTFDTMGEAVMVYLRFVRAFITGDYSYEDRKSWLREVE